MLIKLAFIFAIFSVLGWFGELFYRNVVGKEHNHNPGFLKGPYLPIYGFGAIIVYFISLINMNSFLLILFSVIALTLLELVSGLVLKKLNINLWDYSKEKFNYKGIICLKVVIIWIIISVIAIIWIMPIFHNISINSKEVIVLLGLFYIIVLVDMIITVKRRK